MQQHFRILGWFLFVFGTIGMVLAVILGSAGDLMHESALSIPHGHSAAPIAPDDIFGFFGRYMIAEALLLAVTSLIGMAAGNGLLRRRPWARPLTIVASILVLPGFPFWTALGIYGLWVMFSAEGVQAWKEYIRAPGDSSS